MTPDRTLPNNSIVTINGSTFNITGGTQAGRNLFHSFQQFSVRGSLVEATAEFKGMKSGNISLWATDKIEISGGSQIT
ncbi:two-partner secretion domain-containing protein [Aetokthonos hydrillicola]|uniref:two-partner secretion domain-containing protein n=1 Tax=Aetokthonos hydrillicola TaxID=1550245 RepID=UPI0028780987|nr:hypothetical protein [Aetokthonos hydrillicola]